MNRFENLGSILLWVFGILIELINKFVSSSEFSVLLSFLSFVSFLLVIIINIERAILVIRRFILYVYCKLSYFIKKLKNNRKRRVRK